MISSGPIIIAPPATEPVTLAEAKEWCRVDHASEDATITRLIVAAREHAELLTHRSFVTRTLRLQASSWPDDDKDQGRIRLMAGPVSSVSSVQYLDELGVLQTLGGTEYQTDLVSDPAIIARAPNKSWPTLQSGALAPVRVDYVAGYGAAAAVPSVAKQLVLLLAAHWYENREAVITGTISKEVERAAGDLAAQLWDGVLHS